MNSAYFKFHPSDSRMTNRSITYSNNLVHDVAIEYRSHVGLLMTYLADSTMANNEVYNMPYTGISIGYGWGANDPGGSQDYIDRGLYNYQPRYTTATVARNDTVAANYVHDVMRQMTDGAAFYSLSALPGTTVNQNYFRNTNGWLGLYFDEGSRYLSAANNVFENIGQWAYGQLWPNNNTGNLTLTNNWTTGTNTNITSGSRGNTNTGTVVVSGGNWPSGARSVMASAGIASGSSQQNVQIVGGQSGRCVDVPNSSTTNGTRVQLWDCHGGTNQCWTYSASRQLTVFGTKCLDANGQGTTNGTAAIIWDCNGQANQQWNVNANGTITGAQSGLCLDASGSGTANGTLLHLWACHGGANQQWSMRT